MNRPSPSRFPPFSGPGFGAEPTERRSEPNHGALPPGTRLAEFEILSVLGEGEFGILYLAMDHGLQRQVAIKEYLPAALASRDRGTVVSLRSDVHAETFALGLESFVDEARLLARFDHPALMCVYRFWEANRTAYVVMPYYEGVTLAVARQAMARPPDEAWLRDLLLPLLGALDVLHGASCYHLNISPENILLLPDGRPVLLDLGAARHLIGDRTEAATVILGSAFAPIEQYAESTKLRQGPWTNLYALAAVAYYCVSGHSPVAATVRALDDQMEPLFQVVDRLGRGFPELSYSVAFVSAIERALNVRPQERPQSVAEFRRALLGGRGAAESVVVPPPVEEAEPHGASPPLPSSPKETRPFRVFLSDSDGGNVEDASRERSEPWLPEAEPVAEPKRQTAPAREARTPFVSPPGQGPRGSVDADDSALRPALETALRPDPDDFDGSPQSGGAAKAGGWRRTLFMGVAAVALVALGAGGSMMWSDYRDAQVVLPSMALDTEPQGRSAPLLPPQPPATVLPEPPAESPAPVPSFAAAEPRLPPPATAAPEAALGEPPPEEEAAVAETPAERSPPESPAVAEQAPSPPPESPAVAEEAPSPPPPAKVVKKETDNPRVLCGPRTQFSLYRCMKEACERSKYFDHPECKYLRVTDEVRALP
jgi:serine/threonine protein kinase